MLLVYIVLIVDVCVVVASVWEPLCGNCTKLWCAIKYIILWWPGIDQDIEAMVRSCDVCTLYWNNPSTTPLHSWEFPDYPWQRLHLDFAEPFQN